MQVNFDKIYEKFNTITPFKGCIHVGAFVGCERDIYKSHKIKPVAWFEADPDTYLKLVKNVKSYEGHSTYNLLLGDLDQQEVEFNITSKSGIHGNNGSSSILSLEKHSLYHPHIKVSNRLKLPMKRFDTFVNETKFDISSYNFLNVDVQGAELLVIKGMGQYIKNIEYIIAEVNEAELYKNCALISELSDYLSLFGFTLKEKNINHYEYGDALFVRST